MTNPDDRTAGAARRAHGRAELQRVLALVRGRIRLSRGRGGQALGAVMEKVHGGDPLDDGDELRLAHVVESLVFAVEDAEAAARRPRPPW